MQRIPTRTRLAIVAVLVLALVAGGLIGIPRLLRPSTAYSLVEQTTLLVLRGTVQVEPTGGPARTVTADAIVRVGDRIRTGPGSYAVLTYFDGSTTTLDPETDIAVRRLDQIPGGGVNISANQGIGTTWSRVEKLAGTESRFETTTSSSTAFVRGTDYRVHVDSEQTTLVQVVADTVVVESVVEGRSVSVTVEAGLETTVAPGQPPTQPVPSPPAHWIIVLDVKGPVSFYLTDENSRSVGHHPEADAFANQIANTHYEAKGGAQELELPDPVHSYDLSFKAQAEGGSYSATVTTLLDGQPFASGAARVSPPPYPPPSEGEGIRRGAGLARALAQGSQVTGELRRGEGLDHTTITFDEINSARLGPLVRAGGGVLGKAGFVQSRLDQAGQNLEDGAVLTGLCHRLSAGSPEGLNPDSQVQTILRALTGQPGRIFAPVRVTPSAVAGHLDHGDVYPPCPDPGAPPAFSGAAGAFDPANEALVVFGGLNGPRATNFLWRYSVSANTWSEITPGGSGPPPRSGAVTAWDQAGDRMLVFGGSSGLGGALGDLWAYQRASNSWTQLAPGPGQRSDAAGAWDPAGRRLYVVGGSGSGASQSSTLWVYGSADNSWNAPIVGVVGPSARTGAAAAWDAVNGRLLVFGGRCASGGDAQGFCNDLWAYSPNQNAWTSLSSTTLSPPARSSTAAIWDTVGQRFFIFGGITGADGDVDDVWGYSPTDRSWTHFLPAAGAPAARHGHTSVWDVSRARMLVFGGSSGARLFNDLWIFPPGD